MEDSSKAPSSTFALSNLTQTNALPLLPLPEDPFEPSYDFQEASERLDAFSRDPELLLELQGLLQAADVTSIHLRRDVKGGNARALSTLEEALLQRNPDIFTYGAAPASARKAKRPAASDGTKPIQSPFEAARVDCYEKAQPPQESSEQLARASEQPDAIAAALAPVKRRRTSRQAERREVPAAAPPEQAAADLSKLLKTFLGQEEAQSAADNEEYGGEQQQSIGLSDEDDDEERDGSTAAKGCRADLPRLKRLSEQLLHARACGAIPLLPLEQLQRLLKALDAHLLRGRDKVLHRSEQAEGSDSADIAKATEACIAALYVLATPGLPKQAYPEDTIEHALDVLKFNLMSNVMAFHDARLCQIHRPHLLAAAAGEAESQEEQTPKKAKSASKSARKHSLQTSISIPPAVGALAGRLTVALELLAQLLAAVQLQASTVLPLLRTISQTLTVQGLELLQVKAIEALVEGFRQYPAQRSAVLDDIMGAVLPNLPTGKCTQRAFLIGEEEPLRTQMVSALILQLVQVSVQLPTSEVETSEQKDCFAPAMHWADVFWNVCLQRLAASRAQRNDADMDMKVLLEQITVDLLIVHNLPKCPAALPMVLRLVSALLSKAGMHSPDNSVRLVSVDLLGLIASQLCYEAFKANCEAEAVAGLLRQHSASAASSKGETDPGKQLLLAYLADRRHGDTALSSAATESMLCQSFASAAAQCQNTAGSEEEHASLLVDYRLQLTSLRRPAASPLTEKDAGMLARASMQAALSGKGRLQIVRRIAEATNAAKQAPTMRAKAVKALSGVVKSDTSLLALPDVQHSINGALKDEAASVRQAAVDLLGNHIGARRDLAMSYFDTLVSASRDTSTSVRKAAVRILWEACIRVPDFPRAAEACVAVLHRVADSEESIQDLVGKVFHGLWFASKREGSDVSTQYSPAVRAQQLAEVARTVYERGGPGIHVPLEGGHALVEVLRAALGREARERPRQCRQAGRELAAALLQGFLSASEAKDQDTFPHLLAMHALCLADVALCVPAQDAAKHVRCLAPYLKVAPLAPGQRSPDKDRREAECLLCKLAIVDDILQELGQAPKQLVDELEYDLVKLINKHSFMGVVSAACKVLASLAAHAKSAAVSLTASAQNYLAALRQSSGGLSAYCSRFLFILGHLLRYGIETIEAADQPPDRAVTAEACLSVFLSFFQAPTQAHGALKTREAALQALGCLGIARPGCLLSPETQAAMSEALQRSSPALLKMRGLHNLTELLKVEELRLTQAQSAAAETPLIASDKKKGKSKKGSAAALPTQNGLGDSLSIDSSILQNNWEAVLELATDAQRPEEFGSRDPGDPQNAAIRRHAVAVMDAVDRNGLVAPWTAVPHLLALTTDPNSEVSARAMRILRRMAERQPEMLQTCLAAGLKRTSALHEGICSNYHASTSAADAGKHGCLPSASSDTGRPEGP
ncbi:hypothetical protein CVIRNUC_006096 [Coccomyxa viridis]|uniref:Sister chromatid cohesion protein n=1 Tax=Coccomyxa viridis TaxID=1274662 RepID=A0AAV1I819_9CHLO|nr:hypothetical protein CVIRNUC_006096 [Coccomyxa viridis]